MQIDLEQQLKISCISWRIRSWCILLTISYKKQKQIDTCGIFQLYCYVNLFNPVENSQIISDKTLTKKAIEKLLNETFATDKDENESRIEDFIYDSEIKMGE